MNKGDSAYVKNKVANIVMQHLPLGESAANGAIENAFQGVQGQVSSDLEMNIEAKLKSSQIIWPRLVEYAAPTLLLWRISRTGLTAIQRIRERFITAPRPRFGERIMYMLLKVIQHGKPEARWRHGVWIGSIEASDETLIGTPLGQGKGCDRII